MLSQLSEEAVDWLGEWLAVTGNDRHDMQCKLTDTIRAELQSLQRPEPELFLYRGSDVHARGRYTSDTVFSTSYDEEIASRFGSVVYRVFAEPSNVLVDTTIFTPRELLSIGAFAEEAEVILLPGTYVVTEI